MKKIILFIDGMTCSACSSGLEKYLNKQDGVENASVNLIMNNASIEYDDEKLNMQDLEKFVSKAGFKSLGLDNFDKQEMKNKNKKYELVLITLLSFVILYISMAHMICLPQIKYLDKMIHPISYTITLFLLTVGVLILGRDILKNGVKNLIHKTPNMDTLVTIGVISSFVYSLYSTYKILIGNIGYVENLYFESSAVIIFFIKIGKLIEGKNTNKTKEALKQLMTITPNHATIVREGKEQIVTLDEIQKDDIVIAKPGEKIAVDGEIIDGNSHLDESFITGESIPVKKGVGTKVIAGSINYDGVIKYKAEKIGKESTVSEIVKMIAEATSSKAPMAKIADSISSYFVPLIIFISILGFLGWYIATKDIKTAFNVFVSVLVIACPCSLGLATPLAIVVAQGICTKRGILVKTSEALENVSKVKTVVFDKTGTLTKGELTVSKIYNYSELDEDKLIEIVASIENYSEHPIGKGIVKYAKEKNIKLNEVQEFKVITGQGIRGKIENKEFLIGNRALMRKNNIYILNNENEEYLTREQNSIIYISDSKKILGLIGVKDVLRDDAIETIQNLKEKNINTVMLTGDNEVTAKKVAEKLGIEEVASNVTPKEKARKIKDLKKQGIVLMCGDGINDSISLVTADIGVSISSGTDIAMNSSNVVLMNNNLEKINELIIISKRTVRNIKQNLFWAFFYNIVMIPIALGLLQPLEIKMNPMIASIAMTLSSLTVIFNALRLKK